MLGDPKNDTIHKSTDHGSGTGIKTTARLRSSRVDKDLSSSTGKSKYKSGKMTLGNENKWRKL